MADQYITGSKLCIARPKGEAISDCAQAEYQAI